LVVAKNLARRLENPRALMGIRIERNHQQWVRREPVSEWVAVAPNRVEGQVAGCFSHGERD
jgi:hypothetical protein